EARRGPGAQRGLARVRAGSSFDAHLSSVPRNPGAAVPGAEPGHRQAGAGRSLMRATTLLPRLCSVVLLGLAPALTPVASLAQSTPEARLAAFRERVARLEDQDAIENLQATFGYYFDKGLWQEAASLFTRNGTFEYGQSGVYIGQERIRRAML